MSRFDVIVIGSGPGGYVCAIRCAQLGMKTALIEKYPTLGGTCLNVGCIPSKALLDYSERYFELQHKLPQMGITAEKVKIDAKKLFAQKDAVVQKTVEGVRFLMRKNKIEVFHGVGTFVDPHTVKVQGEKEVQLQANYIVIATGSKPSSIPGVTIDKKRIITSTEALSLGKIPKTMLIIGAGVIGLELGSVFARLGTKVTIVEYLNRVLPGFDLEAAKALQRILEKELEITFYLNHKVTAVEVKRGRTYLTAESRTDAKELKQSAEYCLVATGRRPYTEGLGLENAGLQTDERGRIPVNEHLQTAQPHIYAIGDVVRGPMLAHKASDEGIFVAEHIAGLKPHINYLAIPSVVYTWPELAMVGFTEEELKEQNVPYKVGKFPFMASGRARASLDTEGFIKVLAHKETDQLLGVHMLAPRAADMIAEVALAMEYKASAEDIALTCHPHPTFSEVLREAALAVDKKAIHI